MNAKQEQDELSLLRDWCVFVLRFLSDHEDARSRLGYPGVFEELISVTERTFEKGDLRGLRLMSADLHEAATGLRMDDRTKLREQLLIAFGPLPSRLTLS
jgi:hypothetical protein